MAKEIVWLCKACKDKEDIYNEMTPEEMAKHVKTVHKIAPGTKGVRSLIMHINRRSHHTYQYEWKFGDLIFYQHIST
jgi:hypothetical protein